MDEKPFIKCPLCGAQAFHEEIVHLDGIAINGRDTHLWICDECPFVGFEFWFDQNALDLVERLTGKKSTLITKPQ